MATGGKKDKDSSWGTGLAVVGGIAAGVGLIAGAIWGGKKLYDRAREKSEAEEYGYDAKKMSDTRSHQEDYVSFHAGSYNQAAAALPAPGPSRRSWDIPMAAASTTSDLTLYEKLQEYHDNHVDVDEIEMEKARAVVEDIKNAYAEYIKEHSEVDVEMVDSGSTIEGLKVVAADEFDIMLVIDGDKLLRKFGYTHKKIVHGSKELAADAGGFYFLYLGDSESRYEAQSARRWPKIDKWVENNRLSPVKARRAFQGVTDQFIDQYQCGNYRITRSAGGPAVTLIVSSHGLNIDFVPAYKFGTNIFVAKPHPRTKSGSEYDATYDLLWRKTFSDKERQLVGKMYRQGYTKCLKILKTILIKKEADLGKMNSYVIKTLFFHIYDGDGCDWDEEELAEHFIDAVKELQGHVEEGELLNYFDSNMNLLSFIPSGKLKHVNDFLKKVVLKSKWSRLLQVS